MRKKNKQQKKKKTFDWRKFFKKGLIRLAYKSYEIPFFMLAGAAIAKLFS